MRDADVVIVGAGPGGCSTVLHLLDRDPRLADHLLLLDRARFPRPKLCGGGITWFGYQILEQLGLVDLDGFGAREIRVRYRGRQASFHGDPTVRLVEREAFDARLLAEVRRRGARVREGVAVRAVQVHRDRVELFTGAGTLTAAAVVAADGSGSAVRRSLPWARRTPMARTLEVLTPVDPSADPEHVDRAMTLDFSGISSHGLQGYSWAFPTFLAGRPHVSLGVYDSRIHSRRPKALMAPLLDDLVAAHGLEPHTLRPRSFPIRLWDGRCPASGPRAILVGDAAGADPLLGEGIPFALAHGEIAAESIVQGLCSGDLGFAGHSGRLVEHPVLRQLPTRHAVARILYRLRNPILLSLTWVAVRRLVANLDRAGRVWRGLERLTRAGQR